MQLKDVDRRQTSIIHDGLAHVLLYSIQELVIPVSPGNPPEEGNADSRLRNPVEAERCGQVSKERTGADTADSDEQVLVGKDAPKTLGSHSHTSIQWSLQQGTCRLQ